MTYSNMWHSKHENDGKAKYGGRDVVGYARSAPNPQWPKRAKVALNFVINYEEGGEKCLLHGDTESEKLLTEIVGAEAYEGQRHVNMESLYDYGSRAGFWRLHRLFTQKKLPCTVFAVGMALERNPQACKAMMEANWEVASHGYRWIDYQNVDEDTEREHIARTVEIHKHLLGKRPVGFYQGKPNTNTRKLVIEEGGFLYDSDSYADDLPYWDLENGKKPHLIVPYTLSENDMKFVSPGGFSTGHDFCQHLKDTLKYMVEEGRAGHARMMTVGLHCRIVGRPGRAAALAEFMDYAKSFRSDVWICTREEIAQHWHDNHYPRGGGTVSPEKPMQPAGKAGEEQELDVI
mmetsp:Transcript_15893/g.26616  ORF Transcript_15893/g.26616 Transcript_15893/m.26616 type:complete len:347 (-) Transcript_15893:178-1218(-)